MKNLLLLLFFCIPIFLSSQSLATLPEIDSPIAKSGMYISLNLGYDIPHYKNVYAFYRIGSGPKTGLDIGYNFQSNFGFGLTYDFMINKPSSELKTLINGMAGRLMVQTNSIELKRHFIGIGPQYSYDFGDLTIMGFGRIGYGLLKGGDLVSYTNSASDKDYHLVFSGFDGGSVGIKGGVKLGFNLSPNFVMTLGVYHLRYMSVTPDNNIGVDNIGNKGIVYGSSPIQLVESEYAVIPEADALAVVEASCSNCSSTGVELGLRYKFGSRSNKDIGCLDCICPDDKHKVIIKVEDGPSGKIIPNADVVLKDPSGNIVASGRTNSFGVVDFGSIPHNDYKIEGKVLDIQTSGSHIMREEFIPNAVINKVIKYEDLRFILKGKVTNNRSQAGEPNVVVNLTNTGTRNVEQSNSDGTGEFSFRIEKNSSYEVVGVKENKLSDIDRASTVGLNRSTTLFVELKLGVDNFDCGQGTVLDIKYEYDKDALLPESKFELNRLVRYMNDHQIAKVELSSHTDSRGSNEYNQDLSQRRAQSAVNYITSRGVNRSRINAFGYGESRHLNHCSDGVNCTEEEHRVNRRTEAKLICN